MNMKAQNQATAILTGLNKFNRKQKLNGFKKNKLSEQFFTNI